MDFNRIYYFWVDLSLNGWMLYPHPYPLLIDMDEYSRVRLWSGFEFVFSNFYSIIVMDLNRIFRCIFGYKIIWKRIAQHPAVQHIWSIYQFNIRYLIRFFITYMYYFVTVIYYLFLKILILHKNVYMSIMKYWCNFTL